MDGAKGEDYFEWEFKVKFKGKIDETVLTILQDYGATIVHSTKECVYFN